MWSSPLMSFYSQSTCYHYLEEVEIHSCESLLYRTLFNLRSLRLPETGRSVQRHPIRTPNRCRTLRDRPLSQTGKTSSLSWGLPAEYEWQDRQSLMRQARRLCAVFCSKHLSGLVQGRVCIWIQARQVYARNTHTNAASVIRNIGRTSETPGNR